MRKRLFALLGYDFARCAACAHRFLARPGGNPAWARCPRCLAQDLSIWDPGRYRANRWNAIKLWMGGHPWRCERCRTNFVSFRARKTEYVRPRAD